VYEDSRLRQTIRKESLKESQQFLDAIGSAEMEARNTEESDKVFQND
jgi:hypothetical protein